MDNAWENFLEAIAVLLSKALTDKETEKVIAGFSKFPKFQQRLQRLSSHNLQRLHLEITQMEKKASRCKHEGKTCSQNVARGFFKTWMISYVTNYSIGVLPALLTGKAFKNPSIFKKSGGSDTVGFAFFLASFLSAYKAVLCSMRHNRPYHEGDSLNAFVAGSIAGLTLLLDKNKSRRTALTLYLFTRSIQFGSSYSMKKWAEHREAKKSPQRLVLKDVVESSGNKEQALVTSSGWDDILAKIMSASVATVVMSLTASANVYACIIEPDTVPKSYWKFLMQQSGMPQKFGELFYQMTDAYRAQYDVLKDLPAGSELFGIPAGVSSRDFVSATISPNIASLYPSNIHHDFQLCALLHPRTQCTGHTIDLVKGEFGRAVKLYSTLNIIVTLVFQHKKLATQPKEIVQRYFISTLRHLLNGILAGFAVLIEAPGRQMELALYCLPRALETTWKLLLKRGLVRNIPYGDIALFSASMGVMMTLYQNDPGVINKHYLTVLTRVFGRN
ncbi:hypothetical protein BGX33_005487 [Mortierella sp. NVP41]|nr:hypothetical protein BGX33_005487 [Mortierella sp. NVP41]